MFEDLLQSKLKKMEKNKSSVNPHAKNLKEYLSDRAYFLRRYLSNIVEQIPQKYDIRRSVELRAREYALAMNTNPDNFVAYLNGVANSYGLTLEQLSFHAAVKRKRTIPDKAEVPIEFRGKEIEWREILY